MIKVIIYSEKETNRLNYILEIIFSNILHVSWLLTTQSDVIKNSDGIKINYSAKIIPGAFHIVPHGLLFEEDIKKQRISVTKWNELKIFFQTNGDLPFDIFSAAFYLVTRYEEYFKFIPDRYGRFEAEHSLAFNSGFLKEPLIDKWTIALAEILKKEFPEFSYNTGTYKHLVTIDVDNAWIIKYKGVIRTLGGFARSVVRFDVKGIFRRLLVLSGVRKDPADTWDYVFEKLGGLKPTPVFFFLVGKFGLKDRNISLKKSALQQLVKEVKEKLKIGIHPSYNSHLKHIRLEWEIDKLEEVIGENITRSRQHYLLISMPATFNHLIQNGITDDYSLGFASELGFRASIARPYLFFDLPHNVKTGLTLHPLMIMDATLNKYLRLKPKEAIREIEYLQEKTREVGGTFVSLWHNEYLNNSGEWRGWRKVFETAIVQ